MVTDSTEVVDNSLHKNDNTVKPENENKTLFRTLSTASVTFLTDNLNLHGTTNLWKFPTINRDTLISNITGSEELNNTKVNKHRTLNWYEALCKLLLIIISLSNYLIIIYCLILFNR